MGWKKAACLLLALLCVIGAAQAEEAPKPAYILAGFDDTQYRTWADNQFFIRMEEKTGVSFAYQQYKNLNAWTQAKADMKAGDEMPDVLFKAALTSAECISMREKGVLIDLKPYLSEYAPNLWAILQQHPDYLSAITLPDGSIAALPFISNLPVQNYLWVNSAWLNTLHLQAPTTAEELVTVLTAFSEKDPNRNGRQDEIPLGFLGPFDLKFLGHAFGLIANDYNIFVEDGQVMYMPLDENYRLFVTWLRDLYEAELLDQNGFLMNSAMRTVTDSNAKATYGMILAPVAADVFRTAWGQEDYQILMPLTYEGKQAYRDYTGPLLRGTFAVTSACKDPGKMLSWADTLYTEEGAILASVGLENVDYLIDGDGTWRMTQSAISNSEFFSALTLIDGGASYPGIMAENFQRRYGGAGQYTAVLEQQDAFRDYAVMPFPYCSLTAEQLEKAEQMQKELGYYVDVQMGKWVQGQEEISDASFDAFEERLNELGVQEFIAFWQDILDQL